MREREREGRWRRWQMIFFYNIVVLLALERTTTKERMIIQSLLNSMSVKTEISREIAAWLPPVPDAIIHCLSSRRSFTGKTLLFAKNWIFLLSEILVQAKCFQQSRFDDRRSLLDNAANQIPVFWNLLSTGSTEVVDGMLVSRQRNP